MVTSSDYTTIKYKVEEILFKYFPFIDIDHIIVTNNKQMVRGDVLVDDGIHNHIGGKYLKLLMDAPHNISVNVAGTGMIRVKTWPGIYQIISDYSANPEFFSVLFGCKDINQN